MRTKHSMPSAAAWATRSPRRARVGMCFGVCGCVCAHAHACASVEDTDPLTQSHAQGKHIIAHDLTFSVETLLASEKEPPPLVPPAPSPVGAAVWWGCPDCMNHWHTHTPIPAHTHARTHARTHAHTYMHTYIHTCTHTHMYMHTHKHKRKEPRTHTHTCTTHTHNTRTKRTRRRIQHTHTHAHTYRCTHKHTYTHEKMNTTHMQTQTHSYTRTHTHTHAHTHTCFRKNQWSRPIHGPLCD